MSAEPASEKGWTRIFKGLGNENRLKIVKFPHPTKALSVTEIREKLGISFKWTSQNLVDLEKIGILESKGIQGRVIYRLNPNLPKKVARIIRIFL